MKNESHLSPYSRAGTKNELNRSYRTMQLLPHFNQPPFANEANRRVGSVANSVMLKVSKCCTKTELREPSCLCTGMSSVIVKRMFYYKFDLRITECKFGI